jgi:hypothetical protein
MRFLPPKLLRTLRYKKLEHSRIYVIHLVSIVCAQRLSELFPIKGRLSEVIFSQTKQIRTPMPVTWTWTNDCTRSKQQIQISNAIPVQRTDRNATDEETVDLSKIRQDPERSCPSRREQRMHAHPPRLHGALLLSGTGRSHYPKTRVRCSGNLYALEEKERRCHVLGTMARIGPCKRRSFFGAKSSWLQQRGIGRALVITEMKGKLNVNSIMYSRYY